MNEEPPEKVAKISEDEFRYKLSKELEDTIEILKERICNHDLSVTQAQNILHETCNDFRMKIDKLEEEAYGRLSASYAEEKTRLDQIYEEVTTKTTYEELSTEELENLVRRAKSVLLVDQSYDLVSYNKINFDNTISLNVNKVLCLNNFVPFTPKIPKIITINSERVYINLADEKEYEALSEKGFFNVIQYRAAIRNVSGKGDWIKCPVVRDNIGLYFVLPPIPPGEEFLLIVHARCNKKFSNWSKPAVFHTQGFDRCCTWKECPENISTTREYLVFGDNHRSVKKINDGGYATIIGSIRIPEKKICSWAIKIIKSENKDGNYMYFGVAPYDINQNIDTNHWELGWYFNCYSSTLCSGPPHNYWNKKYGPRFTEGKYVKEKSIIKITLDTNNGNLFFSLDDYDLGCAFEGIPLDKPLLPVVLIWCKGDIVELSF